MLTKLHNLLADWLNTAKTWCASAWQKMRNILHNLDPLYRAWILALRIEPWPDDDEKSGKERLFAYPWGVTVAFSFGRYVWTGKPWKHDWSNPNANVFRCPIPLPGLFISVKTPQGAGGYIGSKPYNIDADSERCQWANLPKEEGAVYMHPSASIRKTVDR